MITLELSPEAEALLQSKAAAKGVSVEKYVEELVVERPTEEQQPDKSPEELYEIMMRLAKEWHALPTLDHRSPDEIIGYDDYGLPTR
jgi:antitoxin VapB